MLKQLAKMKAKEFVQEQSCGEWGDELIEKDAERLIPLLIEFYELGQRAKGSGE